MAIERTTVLLLIVAATLGTLADAAEIPSPPVRNVIDTYYGVPVEDPYRYMEDINQPEVSTWMRAQADRTDALLKSIPGRAQLLDRVTTLESAVAARVRSVTRLPNGRIFYLKQKSSELQPSLYMRERMDGRERLLVDPARHGGPGLLAITAYFPSPTGRYIAYNVSERGSERATTYVMEVKTLHVIGAAVDRTDILGNSPAKWRPDERGFYFNRLNELTPGTPGTEKYRNSHVYYFDVAQGRAGDQPAFGNGAHASPTLLPEDRPFVIVSPDGRTALGGMWDDAARLTLYVARAADLLRGEPDWHLLVEASDEVSGYDIHGDALYLLTHKNAPRSRVLRLPISAHSMTDASPVLEHSKAVIQRIKASRDGLYVQLLDGGKGRLARVDYHSGRITELALPYPGSVRIAGPDVTGGDGVLVEVAGWTHASQLYRYTSASQSGQHVALQPLGPFDAPKDLVADEVTVPSHDGVLVPLSIIHRKDVGLTGDAPTILTGYGAYGFAEEPAFDPRWLAWLERGGVYAVAHVRGGGEYGEEWHNGGRRETKPNTWKDAIACASYLIAHGYTRAERLGITGASAGGILVGRAITERPDLFAAAVTHGGVMDSVRMETTRNGPPNVGEFGSVKDERGFRALLAMSPYYHVANGVHYPAVMLSAGVNDPRVDVWMSVKMAARLAAASPDPKLVLLRLDYDAGHGIGSSAAQRRAEFVDTLTFMGWQFGEHGFQPAPH